jgi:hypothetical protein
MLADPTPTYSAFWYFFKVEAMPPGDYVFTIIGFFRDAPLHQIGVQPVALSMAAVSRGIGWQRFGNNMNFWCSKRGSVPEWSLSFTFKVAETDTMYFAYLYPYTYSDLSSFLRNQPAPFMTCVIGKSHGDVDVPAIYWDSDIHKFGNLRTFNFGRFGKSVRQPLIVVVARHHPGECNASYAMEGFIQNLFGRSKDALRLLKKFSFLMIPMINVDGVICGYYRPGLTGYDMNRSWQLPNAKENPVEHAILTVLDRLSRSRQILFFLDFHGHSAECNSFTYGVWDEMVPYNDFEGLFPRLMSRATSLFSEDDSSSLPPQAYASTMRVAVHHRYQIPFAYTLEMSFGGINIGPRSKTQLTPDCYREIGTATVKAMATMLLDHVPLQAIMDGYSPPPLKPLPDPPPGACNNSASHP